ncbi:4230_t:CDS:10 [Acaulospora colombiana]|uniref:4230_t:CDS:1 n=1 Tax=Acaulospora colombiana TaxID=27376 RepID=A0ACA9JZV1_9GLOM|nr:4230_t:CDS:10 [Acaulospora colombiana]
MLKKKFRNNRTRIDFDDDEEVAAIPSLQNSDFVVKKKAKKLRSKTGLSFGAEEDEDETFKVTKSSASRRLTQTKLKKDSLPLNSDRAATTSSPYTKEFLSELRASTPATPASFKNQNDIIAEKFPSTFGFDEIPDESTIQAAKKKRVELRQRGSLPDYIPLSDNTDVIRVSGKQLESRLVREEDEVGDAEDELAPYVEETVALGKRAEKEQKRIRKAGIEERIMEEDDEYIQWEMEAIKKGGHIFRPPSPKPPKPKPPEFPVQIPSIVPIPTITEIQSMLDQKMMDLKFLQENHQSQLIRVQRDMENIVPSSEKLDADLENTKNRYTYFQELRLFVENLVEFLDVKFPTLEKLESDFHTLLSERSELNLKRIALDDSDDLALFCDTPTGSAVNDAIRQNRRQQRDRRRASRLQSRMEIKDEEEGFSTDDELGEEDKREFLSRFDEISYYNTKLFENVSEEYGSMDLVKSKFYAWKRDFYEDYSKAFGDLSLPEVFEFYVRHEILLWESFQGHSNLDEMKWFRILREFDDVNAGETSAETGGGKLTSKVVEKVILPRVKRLVDVMDPHSSSQTKSAIEFFESSMKFVDKSSQKFKARVEFTLPSRDFASAISKRLDNVITSVERVPEGFYFQTPEINLDVLRARDRYFWRKYKLLHNLIMWKDHLSEDALRPLAVEHLIDRCLLRVLVSSSTDASKFEKLLDIIPDNWLSHSMLEKIARGAAGI